MKGQHLSEPARPRVQHRHILLVAGVLAGALAVLDSLSLAVRGVPLLGERWSLGLTSLVCLLVVGSWAVEKAGLRTVTRWVAATLIIAAIICGYGLLLWKGPWWFDGSHLRKKDLQPADGVVITGFRTALVALGAGFIAALGLYYTHRSHKQTEKLFDHTREKDREQTELTREGQVTDRYVEAIKLLSSENLTQRLGGIYSLERIMRDSAKDHGTVVDVLAAFVRQHASKGDGQAHVPSEDIRAAMVVLGRRPKSESSRLNLAGVQIPVVELANAQLPLTCFDFANLRAVNMDRANLTQSEFHEAILSAARLSNAILHSAVLRKAQLDRADLTLADFWRADLSGANFARARLNSANLAGADLRGADLRGAQGVAVEQLCKAILDKHTQLAPDLAADAQIQERIRKLEE
ncbi:pentapeptide repeat-containing protein [Streptomyces antibioticus]|uniref:pentapeptide repeat-containing protein n=1 Tax=Streptomyces antibioticus TaxID=1890 RepID=UPI003F4846D8